MDVGIWLRNLGLGQYESSFNENEIGSVLPSLAWHVPGQKERCGRSASHHLFGERVGSRTPIRWSLLIRAA